MSRMRPTDATLRKAIHASLPTDRYVDVLSVCLHVNKVLERRGEPSVVGGRVGTQLTRLLERGEAEMRRDIVDGMLPGGQRCPGWRRIPEPTETA